MVVDEPEPRDAPFIASRNWSAGFAEPMAKLGWAGAGPGWAPRKAVAEAAGSRAALAGQAQWLRALAQGAAPALACSLPQGSSCRRGAASRELA